MELENYECTGCRNDGNTHMGCGDCPSNSSRIKEWQRKYGNRNSGSYIDNASAIITNKGGCGFISD